MNLRISAFLLFLITISACSSPSNSLESRKTEKALIRYVPTVVKDDVLQLEPGRTIEEQVLIDIENGQFVDEELKDPASWLLCATEGNECIYRVYRIEGSDSTLIAGQKFAIVEPEFNIKFNGADENNSVLRSEIAGTSGIMMELKTPETELDYTILSFEFKTTFEGKLIQYTSKSVRLTAEMIGMIKSGQINSFEISNVQFKYGCNPNKVVLDQSLKVDLK